MPFYEYECQNCKFYVEVLQKISDPPLAKCPSCGKSKLKKLISAPVFRLKGGGWYETDFKSDKENKRNLAVEKDADSAPAGDKAADSKATDTKADVKPAAASESKTGESKAAAPESKSSGARASSAPASRASSSRSASTPSRARSRTAGPKTKAPAKSKAKPAARRKTR
jgi:putative FmdB family regulatory protein